MEYQVNRKRHRREEDRFLPIRNVLNLIFILGALVGVGLYFFFNRQMGTFVVLGAMVFKIVECILRFIR